MIDLVDAAPTSSAPPSAPAAGWASGPLGAVQAADREIARQTALRARAVAEFAASRPTSADRPPGQPGAMSEERRAARPEVLADVSEWAAQELVVALSITSHAAEALLTRSLTLVHRLPRTLTALETGALHIGHLWPMLDKVAPIARADVRARVEAELLDWAAGRVTTPAQLGAKARRLVLRLDARDAAGELTAALRRRGVSVRPDSTDGMAVLSALLTVPEAKALLEALGRYADALDDDPDDRRTRGQKMADCLLDLVLRPGGSGLSPVQAQLTVVASVDTLAGGDEPGEIGGEPGPAEMVRALARALGLLPSDSAAMPASTASAVAEAAELQALEDWWTATEERVLAEGWRGAEAPPWEEQLRFWAEEAAWQDPRWPEQAPDPGPVEPSGSRSGLECGCGCGCGCACGATELTTPPLADDAAAEDSWAAADRSVEAAGGVLLHLERALGRAARVVRAAEAAEAADDGSGNRQPSAPDALTALASATAEQRAGMADLFDRTGGGGLVDRPRIAVVDALDGTLRALTDSRQLRAAAHCGAEACRRDPGRCTHDLSERPGLGPPPPTPAYRPGAQLDRYLRARDRRCRFPGCRAPVPRNGELDHDRPYPDGPTDASNLAGYCTPHHRAKHQAPGWLHDLAADGTLTVRTPSGLVACTTPPPY